MRFNSFWRYRRITLSPRFAYAVWRSRRNIRCSHLGLPLPAGPFMAELDVTYQCNCQCQMCQRWQDLRSSELTLGEYRELAGIFHDLGVYQVSIAGGEPLLRGDIFSIIKAFSQYSMSVNLCTNGILLEKCVEELCGTGALCITVSVDGATARCHDEIRGAPGSHQRIERGLRLLMTRNPADRPVVRVRMTISDRNLKEVRRYCATWGDLVDDVLLQPVHRCGTSYYTGPDEVFQIDPNGLREQLEGTPFEKDGYMGRLLASPKTSGTFDRHRCYAGVLMTRIDPWGNVYPCLEQHVRIGSLREHDFKTIWRSDCFDRERRRIISNGDCACWYNNTAMISHYGRWLHCLSAKEMWNGIRSMIR